MASKQSAGHTQTQKHQLNMITRSVPQKCSHLQVCDPPNKIAAELAIRRPKTHQALKQGIGSDFTLLIGTCIYRNLQQECNHHTPKSEHKTIETRGRSKVQLLWRYIASSCRSNMFASHRDKAQTNPKALRQRIVILEALRRRVYKRCIIRHAHMHKD